MIFPVSAVDGLSNPGRRRLLVGCGLLGLGRLAWSASADLPAAVSLPEHLAAALRQGSPLVVMVSLPGCPFCRVARENYLAPMLREQKLPIVQVDMHSKQVLRAFSGAAATHERQIQDWRIRIAPTVLFFGPQGAEVAERLVGAMLPDFYGAYLEQRMATARKAL